MNRRQCEREPTNLKVYVGNPPHAKMLQARNISSNGVFLEGWANPPACGTEVSLAFVLDSQSQPLLLHRQAHIARVTDTGVGLIHDVIPPPRTFGTPGPWSSLNWPMVE